MGERDGRAIIDATITRWRRDYDVRHGEVVRWCVVHDETAEEELLTKNEVALGLAAQRGHRAAAQTLFWHGVVPGRVQELHEAVLDCEGSKAGLQPLTQLAQTLRCEPGDARCALDALSSSLAARRASRGNLLTRRTGS